MTSRLVRLAAAAAATVALVAHVHASVYPDKPVQYIIPFPAGGESDIAARLQQQTFSQRFKQEMVVIDRARMVEGGFEVTDIGYEQMPAFMKERVQVYMGTAKLMGLVK